MIKIEFYRKYKYLLMLALLLGTFFFLKPSASASVFFDDFSIDTTADYTVVNFWTGGGIGQFLYDAAGQRLQVLTGSDVGLQFSHALPESANGTFSIDLLPTVKYRNGGVIRLRLIQDETNYYQVRNTGNTAGYGPSEISKVVNGQVVESVSFQNEYVLNSNNHIAIHFSPGQTVVNAFGEEIVMATDSSSILVSSFEVRTYQQDAYYDNIAYSSDPWVIATSQNIWPQKGPLSPELSDLSLEAYPALIYQNYPASQRVMAFMILEHIKETEIT